MSSAPRGIAEALNTLIAAYAAMRGKKDLSPQELAEAIRSRGGSISHTTIWKLRTGQETNPRIETLNMLAAHFGVGVKYFFDDDHASRVNRQLKVLQAMHSGTLLSVATRLEELSPAGQDAIVQMIDRTLEQERENRSK
jgi:transcriptional regulator with XRE-family HTH domain